MPIDSTYREEQPSREEIDRTTGLLLLEFGASWCGYCNSLAPDLEELLEEFPQVEHIRIADGRGKSLGRSFRVKLWPTLIFLRNGDMIAQMARPDAVEARRGFEQLIASEVR